MQHAAAAAAGAAAQAALAGRLAHGTLLHRPQLRRRLRQLCGGKVGVALPLSNQIKHSVHRRQLWSENVTRMTCIVQCFIPLCLRAGLIKDTQDI